jgi:hypothetical protein
MAIITVAPAKPPSAAVGVNASATTQARTRGSWSMCRMMTIRVKRVCRLFQIVSQSLEGGKGEVNTPETGKYGQIYSHPLAKKRKLR